MCLRMVQTLREGKAKTEDELRSGGPLTSRTPEMIEKVRQILAQDRRLTLRLIGEELGITKDTAHTIVPEDLAKRKICSGFVPHKLRDEHKAKRMETSGDFISKCDQDPLLLENTSRGMKPGANSSIRNQNGNRWHGVHRPLRDKKESSAKIQGHSTDDLLLRQQRQHP